MGSPHFDVKSDAEIKLLGAFDGLSQDQDAANSDVPQAMQVDLARSTVNEMRSFVKSGHKIELGFGKHVVSRTA